MGATSLVHPRTAMLPPEEQARGNYQYTSPEELAARAATKPALAEPIMDTPPVTDQPRRLIRKRDDVKAKKSTDHAVQHAVFELLDVLPDERAYAVLCNLAKRFNMEIDD